VECVIITCRSSSLELDDLGTCRVAWLVGVWLVHESKEKDERARFRIPLKAINRYINKSILRGSGGPRGVG